MGRGFAEVAQCALCYYILARALGSEQKAAWVCIGFVSFLVVTTTVGVALAVVYAPEQNEDASPPPPAGGGYARQAPLAAQASEGEQHHDDYYYYDWEWTYALWLLLFLCLVTTPWWYSWPYSYWPFYSYRSGRQASVQQQEQKSVQRGKATNPEQQGGVVQSVDTAATLPLLAVPVDAGETEHV